VFRGVINIILFCARCSVFFFAVHLTHAAPLVYLTGVHNIFLIFKLTSLRHAPAICTLQLDDPNITERLDKKEYVMSIVKKRRYCRDIST
jgi:hypothetical protein